MEFSNRTVGVLLAVILMGLISTTSANDFYVGGKDGWVRNPSESFDHWAGRMRFRVHDRLVFKFKKGEDSVLQVGKEGYDSCNVTAPIKKMDDGESTFEFDRSGPFYFISGANGSCAMGQKLAVVVMADRTKPVPTPPPSSSPPSPSSVSPSVSPSPSSATPSSATPSPSPSSVSPSPSSASPSSSSASPSPSSVSPSPSSASPSPSSVSPSPSPSSVSPSPSPSSASPSPSPSSASPSSSPSTVSPPSPSPNSSPSESPASSPANALTPSPAGSLAPGTSPSSAICASTLSIGMLVLLLATGAVMN